MHRLKAVELFGGAGGLSLGVSQAGFEHLAIVEHDVHACETIRENQGMSGTLAKNWPLYEVDVRTFNYTSLSGKIDLLAAGVPCQPFSLGGKGMAHQDNRDMFSEVVRAARDLRPKAILVENVKGLLRSTFKEYFEYLVLAIANPTLARCGSQSWQDHFDHLRGRTPSDDLTYDVHVHAVNAADYGVPQWRDRVLIIAFRSDLGIQWRLPKPTHGIDALVWSQWRTGSYWKEHGINRQRPGRMSLRFASRVRSIKDLAALGDSRVRWRTVRDAIKGLPALKGGQVSQVPNHFVNPGARMYAGHTGSLIDEVAKTLKAGSHGVPGGENSLALRGKTIRYFSVRECARLQTFPDEYVFVGPWTSTMRQIGNAVPVTLGRVIAQAIRDQIIATQDARMTNVIPISRGSAISKVS
jgi:DNA (cytosine-5)-methyltransferase 1